MVFQWKVTVPRSVTVERRDSLELAGPRIFQKPQSPNPRECRCPVRGPVEEPQEPTAEGEQAMRAPSTNLEQSMGAAMPGENGQAPVLTPPLIPPDPAAQDIHWPLRWPRRDGLELGAYPSAVPCARNRARGILREWQLDRFTETATIAISELVTNACLATQAERLDTPVRLWMLGDRMNLGVMVWDASIRHPTPRDADELAEGGRGLALVAAITRRELDAAIGGRWGFYFPPADFEGGKVVWLLLQQSGIADPALPQRQPAPLPVGCAPPRWEPPDPCTLARVHTALAALADSSTHPDTARERSRNEQRYQAEHREEHDG